MKRKEKKQTNKEKTQHIYQSQFRNTCSERKPRQTNTTGLTKILPEETEVNNERKKKMTRWNPRRWDGPHSKRIHTGKRTGNGTDETALQMSPDTLETRQKQAENPNLGYLGWGKCLWNYGNLGRSF